MAFSSQFGYRKTAPALAAAVLAAAGLAVSPPQIPQAQAESCSDVTVVFARGTNEPPGLGKTGTDFTDKLVSKLAGRTVTVDSVDYPALYSAPSAGEGGNALSQQVQGIVRSCPSTKIVLGGYSQGAVVVDLVTVTPIPDVSIDLPLLGQVSLADSGFDQPLPAAAFPHIAAVALFGNPAKRVYDGVLPMPDGLRGRTIDLCLDGDPVCHPPSSNDLSNYPKHTLYIEQNLTDKAVDFVVGKLGPLPARTAPNPAAPATQPSSVAKPDSGSGSQPDEDSSTSDE